jgi:hypothetical protein
VNLGKFACITLLTSSVLACSGCDKVSVSNHTSVSKLKTTFPFLTNFDIESCSYSITKTEYGGLPAPDGPCWEYRGSIVFAPKSATKLRQEYDWYETDAALSIFDRSNAKLSSGTDYLWGVELSDEFHVDGIVQTGTLAIEADPNSRVLQFYSTGFPFAH